MKTYNKLVRDKIPAVIKANGGKCEVHVATKEEFVPMLTQKLLEEVEELIENPCAEEIGDVLEVIETIARLNNISLDEIKLAKINKKQERGGFNKRIILDSASEFKVIKGKEYIKPGYIKGK